MNILLHICCGPCAIVPVQRLLDEGHEVTGLYYNPNIHPLTEYLRRREGVQETAERLGIRVLWLDREYDPQTYFRRVAHRESNRCFHCYQMRLEKTAGFARRGKFDGFSSTLLYSRYQKHEMISDLCRDLGSDDGPAFVYRDFRDGWQEGIDHSLEWGIYRQPYCGCLYSEYERYQKKLPQDPPSF